MQKLITTYRANPTPANAAALVKYNAKHPMARCMLSADDADLLADAINHANREG